VTNVRTNFKKLDSFIDSLNILPEYNVRYMQWKQNDLGKWETVSNVETFQKIIETMKTKLPKFLVHCFEKGRLHFSGKCGSILINMYYK
jgi:hypothetical protein